MNTAAAKLDKLFVALRNQKHDYLNAKKGGEFEERVGAFLKLQLGLTPLLKSDIPSEDWKIIRRHLGSKLKSEFLDVPNVGLKRTFVFQPNGSQEFPDFLVFTDRKLVPLEIKFSGKKQTKPVWNSNAPRANAFYVFGIIWSKRPNLLLR